MLQGLPVSLSSLAKRGSGTSKRRRVQDPLDSFRPALIAVIVARAEKALSLGGHLLLNVWAWPELEIQGKCQMSRLDPGLPRSSLPT